MAISSKHDKKSPSQAPSDFYAGKQHGGAYGKPSPVGDKQSGGPMREKIHGGKK